MHFFLSRFTTVLRRFLNGFFAIKNLSEYNDSLLRNLQRWVCQFICSEPSNLVKRRYFSISEPRGLIRLLQFIFAIFAFATACNGSSSLIIQIPTANNAEADWSYPYNLQNSGITIGNSSINLSASNDIKPSAEFFVFTGVTAMLLSLAFAVMYVLMDRQYRNDERFPIIDLVITVIWAIFWIAGSSAWAQGVTNIRSLTSYDNVVAQLSACSSSGCSLVQCKFFVATFHEKCINCRFSWYLC